MSVYCLKVKASFSPAIWSNCHNFSCIIMICSVYPFIQNALLLLEILYMDSVYDHKQYISAECLQFPTDGLFTHLSKLEDFGMYLRGLYGDTPCVRSMLLQPVSARAVNAPHTSSRHLFRLVSSISSAIIRSSQTSAFTAECPSSFFPPLNTSCLKGLLMFLAVFSGTSPACSFFRLVTPHTSALLTACPCLFRPFPSPLTTLFLHSKKCHHAQTPPLTLLPSPLTLFPVPCSLALWLSSLGRHASTHSPPFSLPFPLFNLPVPPSLFASKDPEMSQNDTLSCSTPTYRPSSLPLSHSIRLLLLSLHGGEGGSCFGLLMSGPSPFLWLHFNPSRSPLPHGGVIR